MKNKLVTLAAVLALVAIIGGFYAKPVMADIRAALVQDVDQPARAPFQTTVALSETGTSYQPITIPAGKRLVVDFVSFDGAAQTSGPYIQPIILLYSSVGGGATSSYYFGPNQSTVAAGQYYANNSTTIYSDSLAVGLGFAGYSPTFLSFNVVISGHLITP